MIVAAVMAIVLSALSAGTPAGRSDTQEWMQSRSDSMRALSGLPPLSPDAGLDAVAQAHAERMAREKKLFHSSTAGRPDAHEICAMTGTSDPFDNWRKSTVGHGQVILDGRQACGFGASRDTNGWKYWVALYR